MKYICFALTIAATSVPAEPLCFRQAGDATRRNPVGAAEPVMPACSRI